MSFILDALKKLEQKRQQGSVPDVMTIHAPERQRHEKRLIWPYFVLGALVLNAVILAAVFSPWKAESRKPAVKASAEQQKSTPPPSPAGQFAKTHQPASSSSQVKTGTAVPDKKPVVPKPSPERVKQAAQAKQAIPVPMRKNEPSPLPESGIGPDEIKEASGVTTPDSDREADDGIGLKPSVEEIEFLRAKIKEETSSPAGTPREKDPGVKRAEADPDDRVPDISQLPEETRRELPSITISAHIYSNNPRSRIVNINGATIKEGDEVTKGIKLMEITMSGVVLEYQGRRFQVRAF